jgi:hypothetical protein
MASNGNSSKWTDQVAISLVDELTKVWFPISEFRKRVSSYDRAGILPSEVVLRCEEAIDSVTRILNGLEHWLMDQAPSNRKIREVLKEKGLDF